MTLMLFAEQVEHGRLFFKDVAISAPELQEIFQLLQKQTTRLFGLISLPESFAKTAALATQAGVKARMSAEMAVFIQTMEKEGLSATLSGEARLDPDDLRRAYDEQLKEHKFSDADRQSSANLAQGLIEHPDSQEPVRLLTNSAIVHAWVLYEAVAKDIWIACLNARPREFAQRCFSRLAEGGQDNGLTSKNISVGLIARHNFDLRNCLGTLLADKFDFTSTAGIAKAYSAAFGDISEIESKLSDERLFRLERMRHLLVHRAGVIDSEFQRQVNTSQSIGEELDIDIATYEATLRIAVESSVALVRFSDAQLKLSD